MRRHPLFPFPLLSHPGRLPGRLPPTAPASAPTPAPTPRPIPPLSTAASLPAPAQGQATYADLPVPAPAPASRNPCAGRPFILLLEDEDALRAPLAEALGRCGYPVLAGDGPEAGLRVLEAIGWERIHLVITDSHLGRDPALRRGHDFHTHWRARHPVPPFVFLSGHGEPAPPRSDRCQVYGLSKPFPLGDLLALVRDILAR